MTSFRLFSATARPGVEVHSHAAPITSSTASSITFGALTCVACSAPSSFDRFFVDLLFLLFFTSFLVGTSTFKTAFPLISPNAFLGRNGDSTFCAYKDCCFLFVISSSVKIWMVSTAFLLVFSGLVKMFVDVVVASERLP
jgi:hypothetical protein